MIMREVYKKFISSELNYIWYMTRWILLEAEEKVLWVQGGLPLGKRGFSGG